MEDTNLLQFTKREELREWLIQNHSTTHDCWILTSRSKEPPPGIIPYNEIVEEALCFGWIDSTVKRLDNGRLAQRLSKRRKGSSWSRINKERYITLEKQGLITEAGQKEWEKSLHIESH